MRKFLIASHGKLAGGIRSSLEMITGPVKNVFLIEAYLEDNRSVEKELDSIMRHVGAEDELIIFTDLLGGSVTNQMIRLAVQDNVHLISGFNLALLIEILLSDPELATAGVIEAAVMNAREQMVYVNKLIDLNSSVNDQVNTD